MLQPTYQNDLLHIYPLHDVKTKKKKYRSVVTSLFLSLQNLQSTVIRGGMCPHHMCFQLTLVPSKLYMRMQETYHTHVLQTSANTHNYAISALHCLQPNPRFNIQRKCLAATYKCSYHCSLIHSPLCLQ